eukprot:jgi/Mesvir1/20687/Mv14895-RA.1
MAPVHAHEDGPYSPTMQRMISDKLASFFVRAGQESPRSSSKPLTKKKVWGFHFGSSSPRNREDQGSHADQFRGNSFQGAGRSPLSPQHAHQQHPQHHGQVHMDMPMPPTSPEELRRQQQQQYRTMLRAGMVDESFFQAMRGGPPPGAGPEPCYQLPTSPESFRQQQEQQYRAMLRAGMVDESFFQARSQSYDASPASHRPAAATRHSKGARLLAGSFRRSFGGPPTEYNDDVDLGEDFSEALTHRAGTYVAADGVGLCKPAPNNAAPRSAAPVEEQRRRRAEMQARVEKADIPQLFAMMGEEEDEDLKLQAAKQVANLSAEDDQLARLMEADVLAAVKPLFSPNETDVVNRVACTVVANLSQHPALVDTLFARGFVRVMCEMCAMTSDKHTQRMVVGMLANMCGMADVRDRLVAHGCLTLIIEMADNPDRGVLEEVGRALANFAIIDKRGRSAICEANGLVWLLAFAISDYPTLRHYAELAICHLAFQKENIPDLVGSGAMKTIHTLACDVGERRIHDLARKVLAMPHVHPPLDGEVEEEEEEDEDDEATSGKEGGYLGSHRVDEEEEVEEEEKV